MNWKKEFYRLLDPTVPSESNYDQAFQLRYDHLPKKLFRYFTPEVHNIIALRNGKLWATKPELFNDPYECSFARDARKLAESCLEPLRRSLQQSHPAVDFSFVDFHSMESLADQYDAIAQRIVSLAKEEEHPGMPKLLDSIAKLRAVIESLESQGLERNSSFSNTMYICSFSEKLNSILLWSHYAGNHKGFAVEYDFSKLPLSDHRVVNLFPAKYVAELPMQNSIEQTLQVSERYQDIFGLHVMVSKHLDWAYEKEWRLVQTINQNIDRITVDAPSVTGVYFGARMAPDVETFLIDVCSTIGVSYKRMELDKKYYRLSTKGPAIKQAPR